MTAPEDEQANGRSSRTGRWLGLLTAALVLLALGYYVGRLVEEGTESTTTHRATEPVGASGIGDATAGRELFVSKGCAMCHQYEGRGGTDGPPLDFMAGRLSAREIAGMSGAIWDHLPAMQSAFMEEGIPFPTFAPGQMEDLIAYLHGGGPPPNVPEEGGMKMGEGKSKGGQTTSDDESMGGMKTGQ